MAAINLDTTQQAFEKLADTPDGRGALDQLAKSLDAFRAKIGVQLNESEFKYVVANLVNQRLTEVPSQDVGGYAQFAQSNVFFPERKGFQGTNFAGVNRILENRFLIRPAQ